MNPHDLEELTAHALGLLDGPTAAGVEAHIRSCPDCRREWTDVRETAALVAAVPPETLVDAPPVGDLALRRALRRIREETGTPRHRIAPPRLRRLVAAAAAAFVLLGGGAVIGRVTAPSPSSTIAAAGGRTIEGAQGAVRMTATITPAAGWVRLAASVQGIAPGRRCTLLVIAQDGTASVAGSWLTGAAGAAGRPAAINGSTIVDPAQVRAVAVRTDAGDTLISVPVPAVA